MVCVCVWCVWCVSSYVPDNLFVYGIKSEGRRVGVAGVEFVKKLSRCLTITQRHGRQAETGRQAGRLAKSEACNLVNFIIYLSLLLMIAHLYSLWFLFCCCCCFFPFLLCFCRVFPLSVHICKFPAREIKFMCIF